MFSCLFSSIASDRSFFLVIIAKLTMRSSFYLKLIYTFVLKYFLFALHREDFVCKLIFNSENLDLKDSLTHLSVVFNI